MHALVASVLLPMTGLDALDPNAMAEPPPRKLREVEQGIRVGKGDGVVVADGIRQSALSKQPLESREGNGSDACSVQSHGRSNCRMGCRLGRYIIY
jgi:hypothetical protein